MATEAQTLIDAGKELAGPVLLDNGAALVRLRVPDGGEKVVSLEEFLDHPLRVRQTVAMEDTDSFVAYFNRFKDENSVVFARQGAVNSRAYQIRGVLDYHNPKADAGHGDHVVTYTPPFSEQWARWKAHSGSKKEQGEFALFIEENSLDVVEPKAAEMIEVSRTLRAKKNAEFVSDQRLADGSFQFTYNEEVKGSAGSKGNLKVPEKFVIGVPVFFNGPSYKVTAFLRYRINEGKLVIWYDLHRTEYVEQAAFAEIVEKVAKGTGAQLFRGSL